LDDFIKAAGEEMYHTKEFGKNRVSVAGANSRL